MKLIVSVKVALWSVALLAGIPTSTAVVQAQDIDLVCYVQTSGQQISDLSKWCGSSEAVLRRLRSLSPAQRKAQFLQSIYRQFQNHPERDVLGQADPDALIGKANQICEAVKSGTYQPPVQINEPDEVRRMANLEEALIDQVVREGFCLGLD
ncbi:hypothetical protein BST81_12775 [Leptolyngbya sp. 'hensonii']|uniref:hypothetical protein n=1 Tax=Leptolyngbya sp. 'hensonii' TaxID=1922337 RepID=UPI00094F507F|nr:hypothetical protein [Leptolyngbya sp. 'hensonii']OLP17925.1 hypothetical protein BST81_12775 [Leptolyngbya sp. 'hensonii']